MSISFAWFSILTRKVSKQLTTRSIKSMKASCRIREASVLLSCIQEKRSSQDCVTNLMAVFAAAAAVTAVTAMTLKLQIYIRCKVDCKTRSLLFGTVSFILFFAAEGLNDWLQGTDQPGYTGGASVEIKLNYFVFSNGNRHVVERSRIHKLLFNSWKCQPLDAWK